MQPPAPTRRVSTYRAVDEFLPLVREHGPAHVARLREFHRRGLVLMAGPMAEPVDGDAMAVFVSREAAEEFIDGDPFVTGGAVAEWTLRGWAEGLSSSS